MYKNLLVATDGSKLSDKALAHGISLAQGRRRVVDRLLCRARVSDAGLRGRRGLRTRVAQEYAKLAAEDAGKILNAAATKAEAAGVSCKTVYAIAAAPLGSDPRRREEEQVRRDPHGIARAPRHFGGLLGSETQKVLTHTKLPVIVVH
jgi:nucleotide-binding universal stress UspA family protein